MAVETPTERRKLFQLQFAKNDGSVFVNFPYYKPASGLVSLVDWPASRSSSTGLSLETGGKVSSHPVKYSHHPNGRAHFSQDGRVRTEIRKQSVPLADIEGHFFTVHLQGLHDFEALTAAEVDLPPSSKRTLFRFVFPDPVSHSLKFVGRLHSATWLQAKAVKGAVSPTMQLMQPDSSVRPAFVWSCPVGWPAQNLSAVVSVEECALRDDTRDSFLLFVGGFDERSAMVDLTRPVSFLALSFPADNLDELRARLGSIDFREAT